MDVVLLDAYGTLLEMPDPVPRLRALLADAGHDHSRETVATALSAEIAFYRQHHDRARDARSLVELRLDCAGVLAAELGGDAPPAEHLARILVESLHFQLFPDALPALDALRDRGVALAVVSNWDCGLRAILEHLGVADRFAVISVSALVGARKPDPAIFHHALGGLGVRASAALHCGDLPHTDCLGAHRAGVAAIVLDRSGALTEGACPRIRSLADLPSRIGTRR